MGKVLSPWCKLAKKTMIDMDLTVAELAVKVGRSREYVSGIINGRIYSEPAIKDISDVLNIPDSVCSLIGN